MGVGFTLRLGEVANHHEPLLHGALAQPDVFGLAVVVDLAEPPLPRLRSITWASVPRNFAAMMNPDPPRVSLAVVPGREAGIDHPHGAVELPAGQIGLHFVEDNGVDGVARPHPQLGGTSAVVTTISITTWRRSGRGPFETGSGGWQASYSASPGNQSASSGKAISRIRTTTATGRNHSAPMNTSSRLILCSPRTSGSCTTL